MTLNLARLNPTQSEKEPFISSTKPPCTESAGVGFGLKVRLSLEIETIITSIIWISVMSQATIQQLFSQIACTSYSAA